ncbi:MAG: hypothetical protein ACTS5F_00460 [Candidatus Hodgkinia cicadicola]
MKSSTAPITTLLPKLLSLNLIHYCCLRRSRPSKFTVYGIVFIASTLCVVFSASELRGTTCGLSNVRRTIRSI